MRKKTKKKTVSLTSFSRKKITAAAQLRANDFSWLDLSNVWGALSSLLGGAIVEKRKRPNCWKAPAFFHPDWLTTSGHSPTIHVYWHVLYTDIDWRERERTSLYIYINIGINGRVTNPIHFDGVISFCPAISINVHWGRLFPAPWDVSLQQPASQQLRSSKLRWHRHAPTK